MSAARAEAGRVARAKAAEVQREQDAAFKVFGSVGAFVRHCASCRFSQDSGEKRGGLICVGNEKRAAHGGAVRAQWSCSAYEYEPGSIA